MEALTRFDSRFEDLATAIHQLDALLTIVMGIDLTTQKPTTLFHYLLTMGQIVTTAKQICK
ncbi:MAG: hypothetical protein EPO11_02195 [Gammaproteobacteria bacterium]|nr:MAG: hypothetical protein EPO11_02195 [Gammaproteobacteria bacterium]